MNINMKRLSNILLLTCVLQVYFPFICLAQNTEPSFSPSVTITGDTEWSIASSFGDAAALRIAGKQNVGKFNYQQRIRLSLTGIVAPGVQIQTDVDNTKPLNLQNFTLSLNQYNWQVRVGDFSMPTTSGIIAKPLGLLGAEASGTLGPARLSLVLARSQGIPAVKEFIGSRSFEQVRYHRSAPYAPSRIAQYLEANLNGAAYFNIGMEFYPSIMEAHVVWADASGDSEEGRTLAAVLGSCGLLALLNGDGTDTQPVLAPGDSLLLEPGIYQVVQETGVMVFLYDIHDILRTQLQSLIDSYNEQNNLRGSDKLQYPYLLGTSAEANLLGELERFNTSLWVGMPGQIDTKVADLNEAQHQRYYDLGQRNVDENSVEAFATRGGERISANKIVGLQVHIYSDEGIVDLGPLAASALSQLDSLEISYRYLVEEGLYFLGFSLVKGTEKVYLNDKLLLPKQDYMLDYASGILIMLKPVADDDVVRVEYETHVDGLGTESEHQRNFTSGRVEWEIRPGWDVNLHIAGLTDKPLSTIPIDTLRTMPSTHWVAGIVSNLSNDKWKLSLKVSHSNNQYPFDDNKRVSQPNYLSKIAVVDGLGTTLVGEQNGLAVSTNGEPGQWHVYGLGSGLPDVPVRDIAITTDKLYIAAGKRLTEVNINLYTDPISVLDEAIRWRQLPLLVNNDDNLNALAVCDNKLWVGTQQALLSASLDSLDNEAIPWQRVQLPLGGVNALAAIPSTTDIYVAGNWGLALYQSGIGLTQLIDATVIEDIAIPPASDNDLPVYAGGDSGLFRIENGEAVNITANIRVRALAYWGRQLWVAASDGLWVINEPGSSKPAPLVPLTDLACVSLATLAVGSVTPGGDPMLWVGTGGCADSNSALWVVNNANAPYILKQITFQGMSIDEVNNAKLIDISADEHTSNGWYSEYQAIRKLSNGTVWVQASKVEPEFLAVGATQRIGRQTLQMGVQLNLTRSLSFDYQRSITSYDKTIHQGSLAQPTKALQNKVGFKFGAGNYTKMTYENVQQSYVDRNIIKNDLTIEGLKGWAGGYLLGNISLGQNCVNDVDTQYIVGKVEVKPSSAWKGIVRFGLPSPTNLQRFIDYTMNWTRFKGPVMANTQFTIGRAAESNSTDWSVYTYKASAELTTTESAFRNDDFSARLNLKWQDAIYTRSAARERKEIIGTLQIETPWGSLYGQSTQKFTLYDQPQKASVEMKYGISAEIPIVNVVANMGWAVNKRRYNHTQYGLIMSTESSVNAGLNWQVGEKANITTSWIKKINDIPCRVDDVINIRSVHSITNTTFIRTLTEYKLSKDSEQLPSIRLEVSANHDSGFLWAWSVQTGGVWQLAPDKIPAAYYGKCSLTRRF